MNRLTLGQARANRAIYKLIENGTCGTSQIVADRINEAQERLLAKGKWPGLKQKYCFCAYDGCVTLPMELESILAIAIDKVPVPIFSQWYEFVDSGWGQAGSCACSDTDGSCCGLNSPIDQGSFPTFRDICGAKYIRVYCDLNEDAGTKILIRGFDDIGNRVMTNYLGNWIDGEWISLAPPYPQISTKKFTTITSVEKDVTKGYVRLYQYDADLVSQSGIALYHPNETLPIYRRYKIPNLNCASSDTDPATVTLLAKRRFVPAVSDNDDLLITSISALKNMIISIVKEENGEAELAEGYENRATRMMNEELRSYMGGENIRRVSTIDVSPVINVQ